MKPIPFNTEMVRAILEGRKTVTRRVIPGEITVFQGETHQIKYTPHHPWRINGRTLKSRSYFTEKSFADLEAPYWPGDILWVRETFFQRCELRRDMDGEPENWRYPDYKYAATDNIPMEGTWERRPSIHMPLEAARLFLRVTGVRVERLQDIDCAGALAEGCDGRCECPSSGAPGSLSCITRDFSVERFETVWDGTIKSADLPRYGWEANPWVWVIEFERVSKEAVLGGGGDGT